jgi:glycosyltransferase involved in cell wall biosynthesis
MRRLVLFSINSISAIPVFRLILEGIDKRSFERVEMYECFLDDMSKRFKIDYTHVDLLHFKTALQFNGQSVGQKITKYIKTFSRLLQCVQNDVVLYTCDLEVMALAVKIKNIRRSKCVIIYHQFETIERHSLNLVKRLSVSYLKRSEGIDLAIFPEINRMKYFCELINRPALNTFVFPNTCHPKSSVDVSGDVQKFTIGHIGVLSTDAFYLDTLIESIKKLPSDKIEIIFVGVKNEAVADLIRSNIPSAVVIGWLNHDSLKEIYGKLDLGLILYKPLDFNTDYCAPNKMYEYWSYGVPVLGPQLKGLQGLFDLPQRGMLANFENVTDVTAALQQAISNRDTKNKMELLQHFRDNLSVEVYIQKLQVKLNLLANG